MKVIFLVTLLAFSAYGQSVIATGTTAQASEMNGVDVFRATTVTLYPPNNPRVLDIQAVQAEATNGSARIDAIRFTINTTSDCSVTFEYYTAAANVPPGTPNPLAQAAYAAFAMRSVAEAIYEYDDRDNVTGYQPGGLDVLTGFYDIVHPLQVWKPLVISTTIVPRPGLPNITVNFLTWETADEVFYVRFITADAPVIINGIRLTSNRMKMDIGIRWFENPLHVAAPWATGPSAFPNARVGMILVTAAFLQVAGIQVQTLNTSTNGTVDFATAGFTGSFGYVKTAATSKNAATIIGTSAVTALAFASADNNTQTSASILTAWSLRVIYFTFTDTVRPGEVFWDPDLGGDPIPQASTGATGATGATATKASGTVREVFMTLIFVLLAIMSM